MKGRWFVPGLLVLALLIVFLRSTVSAWLDAREVQEDMQQLIVENQELRSEILRYRLEKTQLMQSYFYNERLHRLQFGK